MRLLLLVAGLLFAAPLSSAFGQSEFRDAPSEAQLAEARRHFDLGISHFDRSEWQAALVEFLTSRDLAPTRSNTKNAAICLRKVGRFDEALDLFEALLRDFPDLPAADRELALREISELGASVGTLELSGAPPGAHVSIDGVERGTTPLSKPVRLPAGTHTVRVVKDGSLPFEARVDLPGRQARVVEVRLSSLTQAGRLRVTEKHGRTVEVLVDGSSVGTTPWDGALAPGVHVVSLRGAGNLGTAPTRVAIEVGTERALELAALVLSSELDVTVKPESAEVLVDGVAVGRGSWKGRLGSGKHRIEAKLAGYEPFARALTLGEGDSSVIYHVLELSGSTPRVLVELEAGVPLGLLWGGDLKNECTPPCSASFPIGVFALAHVAYRFSSGVGVGVHGGYSRLGMTLSNRTESVRIVDRTDEGTADDDLRIGGLMAGAEADYVLGDDWPITLRIGAGALIGAATDERSGTFEDPEGTSYSVEWDQFPRASYLYLGPEMRIGYRLGEHFEVSVGAKFLVLAALAHPAWNGEKAFTAGDEIGEFDSDTLTGSIMVAMLPGAALRYAF